MNNSKFIGSILILVGTAVGAGMLALPMISAKAGFAQSAIMLIIIWAIMTITSLLTLEVNLAFKEYANNFSSMATATLGVAGKITAWITCLLLLYALTAAYISGNASLLTNLFSHIFHLNIPSTINALLFVLILGGTVYWSTKTVDLVNRGLWSIKGLLLIATFILLMPHVNAVNLIGKQNLINSKYLLAAVPIFLCSFGFHNIIPSLTNYIGRDIKHLKIIIISGSTITLIIYFLWLLVTLGIVPLVGTNSFAQLEQTKGSIGEFLKIISLITNNIWVTAGINGFASIAMTTSFLGVALSLFDFLADGFKRKNTRFGRLQTALLTFVPPLIFALIYSQGFILALGYAAIFVAILTIILPTLMVFKLRRSSTIKSKYRVMGGTGLLIVLFIIGLILILLQILTMKHLLPM